MLYEFAMTPELFSAPFANSNKGAEHIPELLLSIAENGMLANLDKDRWKRHVEERLATLSKSSPMLKDKILNCLTVLDDRHRLVRHPKSKSGPPSTDQDWLNLAFESHKKIPFTAIILSKELMENCGRKGDVLVDLDSLDKDENLPMLRKNTLSLSQTEAGYRSALGPVLRHARSLFLIDPHMNTTVRFFRTVELCSELLGERVQERPIGRRILIHALKKNQKPNPEEVKSCLDEWEKKLAPLRDKHGHRFQVFLWNEKIDSDESMHDRYILTDQCGISIPGGLDCRGGSTDWSLLDDDVRRRREEGYDPAISPSPFEFVKSRTVESA